MRETWVQSLDWEDPLERAKATHSSILTWRIPYSPWGHKELDMTERLSLAHKKNTSSREFPGGPVVRTPLFHCQGLGLNP